MAAAKVTASELEHLREAARVVTSLDRPVGGEADSDRLGELLTGADEGELEEEVQVSLRREALERAIARLPELERRVIELRYGFVDGPRTLEETASEIGISRDRLRKLEAEALEQLALNREVDGLREAA